MPQKITHPPKKITLRCNTCFTKVTSGAFQINEKYYALDYSFELLSLKDGLLLSKDKKVYKKCKCLCSFLSCSYCGEIIGKNIKEMCAACSKTKLRPYLWVLYAEKVEKW